MKKYVLKVSATFFITCSATTSAATAPNKTNPWEDFYGQFGVGYASFMSSSQPGTTTLLTGPMAGKYANASTANNINGPAANISIGYNLGINQNFILGIGGTYFPGASSSANLSFTTPRLNSTTTGSYNVKNVYNIFLSPGYAIDKARLTYAKVGYTGATVSANAPSGDNSFPNTDVGIHGVSLGLGYKQMVTESIYLLGEMNYAIFNSTTTSVTTKSGAIVNTNIKGNGLDLIVGIGYRF